MAHLMGEAGRLNVEMVLRGDCLCSRLYRDRVTLKFYVLFTLHVLCLAGPYSIYLARAHVNTHIRS